MSKAKRRKQGEKTRRRRPVPSAPTVFRATIYDEQSRAAVDRATEMLKPKLWERDGKAVFQINRAKTMEEVIDLASTASGLAEPAWHRRMRRFGHNAVPLLAQRLQASQAIADEKERDIARERLIAALRWNGDAGAMALLDCIDALDGYTQSLACVVLGLLKAQAGADRIWRCYQEVVSLRDKTYFVGALWGLIDLQDARASGALVDLLTERRAFYELYGFLALAGDARAVLPLMASLRHSRKGEGPSEPLMALVGIAHRIGRDEMLAAFEPAVAPLEADAVALGADRSKGLDSDSFDLVRRRYGATVDSMLSTPMERVEEYFQLFYRGLTPESLDDMLDEPGFPAW
jgi:hypothetical protein